MEQAGNLGHFGGARQAAIGTALIRRATATGSLVMRKLDAVINLLRGLRCFPEHRGAGWAGGELTIDLPVRVRMQRPAHAEAALARRPGQFVEAGLQCRVFLVGRTELREQRQDQSVVLFVAQAVEGVRVTQWSESTRP